ncbi:MAG: BatA domain-containing protein [Gemmataceae bacterium]
MHPILIAGAALVGLPVLLHLILRQEPKRLPFPAVRFLKVRQRINQRKMRLKHFLLLALRCLLIALFALTLFQPRVPTSGLAIHLAGDQPVAAVLVIDTTPSMGYVAGDKTRLADARRRALELLDELPAGSKVAVVDPADPLAVWEVSTGDARRKLEQMAEPRGGGPPLAAGLLTAYQLLASVDRETEGSEPLPRLVAVFSDRAVASWAAERAADLKAVRDKVPAPPVAHLFFDVGVDQPANVSILSAEVRPTVAPVGQPVTLTASVQAAGADVGSAEVAVSVNNGPPDRTEVKLPAGSPVPVSFTFKDLKPGLHQAKVTIRDDNLAADNVRYVTFKVGESRTLLTITDDPSDADYWKLAFQSKGEFGCEVVTPDTLPDLGKYPAVVLLSVSNPSLPGKDGKSLWDKVRAYLDGGGQVLVIPGGPEQLTLSAYDLANPAANFLPAKLAAVVDTKTLPDPTRRAGVSWALDEAAERHPLLAPFREWRLQGNRDVVTNRRRVFKFWKAADFTPESVVVRYDTAADPAQRDPAILERTVGTKGGRVVLLTTRLDSPWDESRKWNDYWETSESSFAVVFPNLLAKHLAGSPADEVFTFPTGTAVSLALPRADGPRTFVLEGPGVGGADAAPVVGPNQAEWKLPPALALTAGSFVLRTADRSWQDGFSLNPPAEEFDLAKAPVAAIEDVCGPDAVIPVGRAVALRDVLESRSAGEVNLFPWLLIGVLVLFAVEGLVANRFYRRG